MPDMIEIDGGRRDVHQWSAQNDQEIIRRKDYTK